MLKRILIICIIFCTSAIYAVSQKVVHHKIALQWQEEPVVRNGISCPNFFSANYAEPFGTIPMYEQKFFVEKKGQKATMSFSNAVFLPVMQADLLSDFELNLITDSLQWFETQFYAKNHTSVLLQLIPYRFNPKTGFIEQLYYADLQISFSDDTQFLTKQNTQQHQYPEKSVLADGVWYKLQVSTSGIYKVTATDLKNAGMDISSVNPKNIKLYGNGGAMIPEQNSRQKYTCLQENAIVVAGENDGVFHDNDYILFYGESPNVWEFDSVHKTFSHQINFYSSYNYYFIGVSDGEGKRIQTIDNNNLTENRTSNISDYLLFHEQELVFNEKYPNPSNGGKIWLGENFNSFDYEKSFTINIPNVITSESVTVNTAFAAKSATSSSVFNFKINGNTIKSFTIPKKDDAAINALYDIKSFNFTAPSSSFTLSLTFSGSNANGWLDYFEIQARRNLYFNGGQMGFCDAKSIGNGNVTKFTIANTNNNFVVWDITNQTQIAKIALQQNGTNASFKVETHSLKQFIGFDGTSFFTTSNIQKVENQNLSGLRNVQSVIVSYPDFVDLAQTLARLHKTESNVETIVVTPQQIYNEFSSGKQDVGAIRDFMRMLYKTADYGHEPEYLLFYGIGSYDYKNIKGQNTNLIPIWTSNRLKTSKQAGADREYSSDDFFGLLDDTAGGFGTMLKGEMNVGIGRFPVKNRQDAEIALDKRLHYTSNAPETKGSWQNIVCFVTDDGDRARYPKEAERIATLIDTTNKNVLIDKIYTDAYKQVHEAGGTRYPDAKRDLTRRINTGSLIVDYIGHGSIFGWAEERIMEVSDAQTYTNYDHLSFFITATCTFSRFDDPEKVSAGEYCFLNPNGSAIALFTTIRETEAGGNQALTLKFYEYLMTQNTERSGFNTLGYACRKAKAETSNYNNTQYFVLLGDPVMTLAFPDNLVKCTAINNIPIEETIDTIKALSKITVSGEIQSQNGMRINDFQGKVVPKVFDKMAHLSTLGNEPESYIVEFDLWKNMIFNGSSRISNGIFDFTFFVPKDIDYTFDYSRISFYAVDTVNYSDATGSFNEMIIGGINPNADIDTISPQMELYMNDIFFVSGGITDENPILLVELFDEHGINATGSSIGHDLVAILDGDVAASISLNLYYETKEDFQYGCLEYPFYNLAEGEHYITVKAWDSYNNSVSKTITFTVVNSENITIQNLYNYPNPMRDYTNFVFEHNQAGDPLNITLQIFDLSGRLVYQIRRNVVSNGYRTEPIRWDGRCNGAVLKNGMYFYRAQIEFSDGTLQQKNNKLIIAR